MKRKGSIGLLAVAAVVAAAVGLQSEPGRAVPPAQASQPVAYAQYCSQSMPGTVQVVFLWNPSYQGQQWLDLSLLNNGFAPGTSVGVGPLTHDRWGFVWDGLLPGRTHYIRVNTLTPTGWVSSRTTTLVTGVCPPPVATLGTPTQECSSQQPGRVKVTFKWTPGASTGTTQYIDLTLFKDGFAPGTFIGAGPLPAGASSFVWDGLLPSTTHFWRVNTLGASGWHASVIGSFTMQACAATSAPPVVYAPPQIPGRPVLVAHDGQYLGVVTCSTYETDGIFNKYGMYGSKYSTTSIWNKYGLYGSKYALYSPFNKYSLNPPAIIGSHGFIAYLSVNKYLYLALNPWDLVSYCFGDDPYELPYWVELLVERTS
ncbi:MAG: hypothetical protein WBF66_08725 [Dehalococcoidia bacterium]